MHKKKAKIVVVGTYYYSAGDAGSGKSSLIQTYVKKNYQFSSDYNMVIPHNNPDSRSRNILQNYPFH
jgi:GTPase SAR1 family protein